MTIKFFETLMRGSTRKMNDIAKLTQEHSRAWVCAIHFQPLPFKALQQKTWPISELLYFMSTEKVCNDFNPPWTKQVKIKNSAPRFARFLFENKNWCNIFAQYSDEIQTSVLVFCWFSVARLLNTALEIVVQTWKKCNLLLKLTF